MTEEIFSGGMPILAGTSMSLDFEPPQLGAAKARTRLNTQRDSAMSLRNFLPFNADFTPISLFKSHDAVLSALLKVIGLFLL